MRIRFLSGNLAGCVEDLPQIEGEVAIATGFGELVAEDAPIAAADPVETSAASAPVVVDDEPSPADSPPVEPSE